jgi:hypothetical protein
VTGSAGHTLQSVAAVLGIIAALLAIWEAAARSDLVGDGPSSIVQNVGAGSSASPTPTAPTLATMEPAEQLDTPSGVSISGDCKSMTLTWDPVEGAERYRVDRDGFAFTSVTHTEYAFAPVPDGQAHSYEVLAEAPPRPRSAASDEVLTEPCSP